MTGLSSRYQSSSYSIPRDRWLQSGGLGNGHADIDRYIYLLNDKHGDVILHWIYLRV